MTLVLGKPSSARVPGGGRAGSEGENSAPQPLGTNACAGRSKTQAPAADNGHAICGAAVRTVPTGHGDVRPRRRHGRGPAPPAGEAALSVTERGAHASDGEMGAEVRPTAQGDFLPTAQGDFPEKTRSVPPHGRLGAMPCRGQPPPTPGARRPSGPEPEANAPSRSRSQSRGRASARGAGARLCEDQEATPPPPLARQPSAFALGTAPSPLTPA